MFLLLLPLQGAPVPHADLHPSDPTGFIAVHDVARIGAAYGDAPIFQFARDEAILGLVEGLVGTPIDRNLLSPGALFDLFIEQLPPEAVAFGLSDLLEDSVGYSVSLNLGDGFETQLEALVRFGLTATELEALESSLTRRMAAQPDELPASLAELVGDDLALLTDAWGRPYTYEVVDDLGPRIRSLGADGVPGGDGVGTDLELTLLGLAEPPASVLEPLLETVGLQFVIEFGSTASVDQLLGLVRLMSGDAPPELMASEFSHGEGDAQVTGIELSTAGAEIAVEGWIGQRGPLLILGALDNRAADLAARLAGTARSFADNETLRSSFDALPQREGTALTSSFGRYSPFALYDLVVDVALDAGLQEVVERNVAEPIPPFVWDLVESYEPDQRPLVQRETLAGSTFYTDTLRPGAPTPSRYFPRGPITADDLRSLNASAAAVYATQVDLVAVYDLLLGSAAGLRELDPEAYHARGVELLGLDLRTDLLAHIEPTVAVSLDPIRGIGTPRLMGRFWLRDPEAVARGLTTLVESIAAALPETFSATTRPYRGMPLARLALRGLDLGPIGLEPTFGVVGDQLVLGLSSSQVKKELRRLAGEEFEVHALVDPERTALEDDVSTVAYLDWPTFVGAAYDTGRTFLGFGGADQFGLPIDLESLPPGDVFNMYFQPHVWTTRQAPAGELTTLTASMGPELALLAQAAGVAASVAGETVGANATFGDPGFDAPAEQPTQTAEERTREAISDLRIALQIYRYEYEGGYPQSLAALSEPTPNFPRGCLDGAPLPVDGWGSPVRYALLDGGSGYRVWSVGVDGVDQGGSGDDVLVEER